MLKITSLGASAGYKANISLPDVAAGDWTGTMTGRLYSEYENERNRGLSPVFLR